MRLSKHEYLTCLYILGDMWTASPIFAPENVRAYYFAPRYQTARYSLTGAL
ncbi:MAG TPA: hypothetical protein VK754_09765 [Propionibacteriaceae bacterium]|nr:hypothetical protein [Propionibacteriaceae bacterium]